MSTGPSENRFTRAGAAERARQDAWLTRRYGGSVWRPVIREVPWAIALAGFGYLTVGPAWALGVLLVLLAVPVGLWWWTNHRVLPARNDDSPS